MNPTRDAKVTRRFALIASGAVAGATVAKVAFAEGPPEQKENQPSKLSKVENEYLRLLPLWQEERKQFLASSSTYDYWMGPHGKAIIALGPAIIPYLIHEVRNGDFWFNVPLALICNIDIANGEIFTKEGEVVSEQYKSQLWLKWWARANTKAMP